MVQVSRLVGKMRDESGGDTESATRKELREKIVGLSPSQLLRATDTLAMIWDGMVGPLDLPTLEPEPSPSLKPLPFLNWDRVKLALLKSISTGTFIDAQFFAYGAVRNGLPMDLRPLYTSSIVVQEWGAAITTRRLISCSKSTQL